MEWRQGIDEAYIDSGPSYWENKRILEEARERKLIEEANAVSLGVN